MFDLSMPWWEFVIRGAAVYGVLMLMVRVSGKRTLGQHTPFDLLVVVLISEAVSNSMIGDDHSLLGGLIVATTLISLNLLLGFISSRNRRAERVMEGDAVLIGRDGVIFHDVLSHNRVGRGDMEKALREADCELSELKRAFLEVDGSISVQKKKR